MLNRDVGPTGHHRAPEETWDTDRGKQINTLCVFACGGVKECFCAQQRVGNEVQCYYETKRVSEQWEDWGGGVQGGEGG